MKQPVVKVRQMANMYEIKIGVRGGGAGTHVVPRAVVEMNNSSNEQ